MLKKIALVTGVVFILVGIMGLIPALTPDGKLLGLFLVTGGLPGGGENVVHILSGIAALVASQRLDWARLFFKVIGVVYALVTVLGFLIGEGSILGLVHVNMADNFLHLVFTAAFLYLGFGYPAEHGDSKTTV